jgi:hypothetical protein
VFHKGMLLLVSPLLALGAVLQFQGTGPNTIEFDVNAQATITGDEHSINSSVYAVPPAPETVSPR